MPGAEKKRSKTTSAWVPSKKRGRENDNKVGPGKIPLQERRSSPVGHTAPGGDHRENREEG